MLSRREREMERKKLQRRYIKQYVSLSLLIILVIGSVYIIYDWTEIRKYFGPSCLKQKSIQHKPEVGACAPNFILKDQNEEEIELYQNDGKPTIIYFWTTRCESCKKDLDYMNKLYKTYGQQVNFMIINATSLEADPRVVRSFIRQKKYPFSILMEQKKPNISLDLYQLPGTPITFILDKEGKIVHKIMGSYFQMTLDRFLKNLSPE